MPSLTGGYKLAIYTGLAMAQQLTSQSGQSDTKVIHEIVQHALRNAATASTESSAIDVLGDALLELERLVANTSVHAPIGVGSGTSNVRSFSRHRCRQRKAGAILGLNA